MTFAPEPRKRKIFDLPILIALVVVVALAVTVVLVLANKGSGGNQGQGNGASSSSSNDLSLSQSATDDSSGSSSDGGDTTVTSTSAGISWDLAADATSQTSSGSWDGPYSQSYGGYAIDKIYILPACAASSGGSDVLVGATVDSSTDLKTAATNVVSKAGSSTFDASDNPTVGSINTGGHQVNGQSTYLAEADVQMSKTDECGTDRIHVGALAVKNSAGATAVLFVSYRVTGSGLTDDSYQKTLVEVLQSMKVT